MKKSEEIKLVYDVVNAAIDWCREETSKVEFEKRRSFSSTKLILTVSNLLKNRESKSWPEKQKSSKV